MHCHVRLTIKDSVGFQQHTRTEKVLSLAFARRTFLKSLSRTALILPVEKILRIFTSEIALASPSAKLETTSTIPQTAGRDLGVTFVNVAGESGLNTKTIFGGEHKNKYLLETTGCGVAFFDYDHDGWLDIFLVSGTRWEGFRTGRRLPNRLFTIIAMARSRMLR